MNITMIIYLIVLFIILTPGQFITLPSEKTSKIYITVTHAIVFGIVWHLTHKMIESSRTQITL
jgi:hypothetical protein